MVLMLVLRKALVPGCRLGLDAVGDGMESVPVDLSLVLLRLTAGDGMVESVPVDLSLVLLRLTAGGGIESVPVDGIE